ncbi:unnamed protein product [Polarella glacialis]|uniref:Methyltransferase FkbM domain-containing protein n=1 Tax=Polarella glacialis TaxID=89957 RepID=A0A813I1P4_POLGL|nr:unnamed protein product [Polarella glacialis]
MAKSDALMRRPRWRLHFFAMLLGFLLPGAATGIDLQVAWQELLEFLSPFDTEGDKVFRVCFLGSEDHTLALAVRLLEIPEAFAEQLPSPIAVTLLQWPAGDEAHSYAEQDPRLEVVGEDGLGPSSGGCSAVILAAHTDRQFDSAQVHGLFARGPDLARRRHRDDQEEVGLLGHFGAHCEAGEHGCRSLHAAWRDAAGMDASCGRLFCGAAVVPEALVHQHAPAIDCGAMTGAGPSLSPASQWQQDWFVYKNFFQGTGRDVQVSSSGDNRQGVFVDVGAFHPIHLSNTYFFERCLGWRGVCVEPNPGLSAYFGAYRPACRLFRNCVWSKPRSVVMHYQKDPIEAYIREEPSNESAAVSADSDNFDGISGAPGVKITGEGQHPEFRATCRTLESILSDAGLRKPAIVDFLSVDAEAAEVEIFRDFPFQDFDISVINVEVQAHNYYELDAVILNAGYAKVAVLGGDHVYAKLGRELAFPSRMAEWRKALGENFWVHEAPKTATATGGRAGGLAPMS